LGSHGWLERVNAKQKKRKKSQFSIVPKGSLTDKRKDSPERVSLSTSMDATRNYRKGNLRDYHPSGEGLRKSENCKERTAERLTHYPWVKFKGLETKKTGKYPKKKILYLKIKSLSLKI